MPLLCIDYVHILYYIPYICDANNRICAAFLRDDASLHRQVLKSLEKWPYESEILVRYPSRISVVRQE